ncbi:hypothetical protein OBBRIDRAFT_833851 [Obba rivulosa]|uniref:Uncharacterized protein n=1 Tax=Obba rivulosa TaxID=1052685 RepID=A0A8E2B172_9APHY|nr:hypothetical protein OBBRIDRAFT_833851 [Obba rivulosa]
MDNFQSALSISLIIVWAVFSTIRVYAISGGNWWISATVCALSMVPAATNLYTHYVIGWFEIGTIPVLGTICVTAYSSSLISHLNTPRFILGTRICAILVDIIVLVATWHRTYGLKKEAMRLDVDAPLATMLLQDGTMYFLGLLVLNSVQIAGWITNDFTVIAQYFITPLTSIITSHFLMDLRSIAVAPPANDAQLDSDNITQRSTIRFSSFVDNMGERLDGASKETEPELEWIAVDDVSLGDPSRLEDVEEVLHQISS